MSALDQKIKLFLHKAQLAFSGKKERKKQAYFARVFYAIYSPVSRYDI
jgi:hypothetical protein